MSILKYPYIKNYRIRDYKSNLYCLFQGKEIFCICDIVILEKSFLQYEPACAVNIYGAQF